MQSLKHASFFQENFFKEKTANDNLVLKLQLSFTTEWWQRDLQLHAATWCSKGFSTGIHQHMTPKPSPEFHFVILFNVIIACIQFISHDNIK